jgi:hypothetical protein
VPKHADLGVIVSERYMETSRSGKVSDFFGMRLTEYVKTTCDVNL